MEALGLPYTVTSDGNKKGYTNEYRFCSLQSCPARFGGGLPRDGRF